ncbi:hypothetical protein ACFLXC_04855 [Chloroflexota bacterium]
MKRKYFRILSIALALALLIIALPASQAFAATATVNTTSGAAGSSITISGSGFNAGDEVQVQLGTAILGSVIINAVGGLPATAFTVPSTMPAGTYALTFISLSSSLQIVPSPAVNFVVTIGGSGGTTTGTAIITASLVSGYVGDSIQITGSGFTANNAYTVYYDANQVALGTGSTATVNAIGSLLANIQIPPSTAGTHTIVVSDTTSVQGQLTFTIQPKLVLTPASGPDGTSLTANGTGFTYVNPVTLYRAGTPIGISAETDAQGSFHVQFNLTGAQSGTVEISATDGARRTASAQFTVIPQAIATITPIKGPVGQNTMIGGTGFKANSTITVTYEGQPKTGQSDSIGSFQIPFIIPTGTSGKKAIVVTDGTNTKQLSFTIESTPPSLPAPQSPSLHFESAKPFKMVWSKSTATSQPVTYTLQIADDGYFPDSSIKLEKKGLTTNEYTLTDDDWAKLQPPAAIGAAVAQRANFWWHVQAIDAASNSSAWSSVYIFYVLPGAATPAPTATTPAPTTGKPTTPASPDGESTSFFSDIPMWAIGVIAFIVVVLFFVLGLWIGRRSAYY